MDNERYSREKVFAYCIIAGSQVFMRRYFPENVVHRFCVRRDACIHSTWIPFTLSHELSRNGSKGATFKKCSTSTCVEDKARLPMHRYNTGLQNRHSTIKSLPVQFDKDEALKVDR